jgi:hypothetical protein
MKLYQLTDAYHDVLEELSEPSEDGWNEGRYQALLAGLGEAFDEKVLSIAKVIRSMEADMAAIGMEVERLQGRKRHLAGRVDWLKRYLQAEMEAVGKDKVRGPTLAVFLAKAPASCEITDEAAVPDQFKRTRVEIERAAVLAHFRETGEITPGTAIINDRRYLRIA